MTLDGVLFKSKSILSMCLIVLAPLYVSGCGDAGSMFSTSTPYANTDALNQKLQGTPFANPKLIEIDRTHQSFLIVSADGQSTISGQFGVGAGGQGYVSALTASTVARTVSFSLNDARQVTQVITPLGAWQPQVIKPPSKSVSADALATSEVDEYVAANAELLDLARQADEQLQATTAVPTSAKDASQSLVPVLILLGSFAIWPIAVGLEILWIIDVVVILNALF